MFFVSIASALNAARASIVPSIVPWSSPPFHRSPARLTGFLDLRLPNWARRLLTRGIAIVPVIVVTAIYGERGTADLLVFSQVVLSMQLPFAVIPLVRFVSDRRKMGKFAIPRSVAAIAWIVAGVIVVLNLKLLFDTFFG